MIRFTKHTFSSKVACAGFILARAEIFWRGAEKNPEAQKAEGREQFF